MPEDCRNPSAEWFVTTRWSIVAAANHIDSSQARAALQQLCLTYWYPLYAYVRRLGHGPHDAEDLVQGFFEKCLEHGYLGSADSGRGRFRSFLLTAFKRFMSKEWRKSRAGKRGSGAQVISLDSLSAEQRYALEPTDTTSADKLYERRWALTLLEHVLSRLEAEQRQKGQQDVFLVLKEFLVGDARSLPVSEAAGRLGMTDNAVKVAVHRLRRRYRQLLEQQIADTVSTPDEITDERRYLLSVLAGT